MAVFFTNSTDTEANIIKQTIAMICSPRIIINTYLKNLQTEEQRYSAASTHI